jgi:protease-4
VRGGPTEIASQDERELLHGLESVYVKRIAEGRHMTEAALRAVIAKGPFVADEAIAAGLIDDKAFDDEVRARVQAMVGARVPVVDDVPEVTAPKSFGPVPRVAVVYLDGDIVDGHSQTIPLLGEKTAGSRTIAEALKSARENPDVKAVVLRIESPGGSSLASDVMWREAELLAKAKPTVVSMGGVAASGGYYAAAFGAKIWADPSTVTGSIGIFYGKADVSGLLDRIGVHVVTERTAPRADAESLYRPFTDEERTELLHKVEQFYAVFLDRVSRGRGMSVEEIDAVGRGKVWLGEAAKQRKLVDEVGGFDQALASVRAQVGLPDDTPLVEYPQVKESLLDVALNLLGIQASTPMPQAELDLIAKAIGPFAHALVPFVVHRADEPLALWEGEIVEP